MITRANALHIPLKDNSVQCCVTSPPYYGLRNYGVEGQLGLERTVEEYVANMVQVFREVRRVLRPDGVCWLNLGDSYFGSGSPGGDFKNGKGGDDYLRPYNRKGCGLKPKDLIGIPWRVAFALQADGWWLRQDIIWQKKNPMPESVTDRCTKAHEYVFLLTKSPRYFYDAEAIKESRVYQQKSEKRYKKPFFVGNKHESGGYLANGAVHTTGMKQFNCTRNRRSVWLISPQPYKGAHFATYPEKLVEPCILAGTSEKGCCPICGTPWVRVVEKGSVVEHPARRNRSNDSKQFSIKDNEYSDSGFLGKIRETKTIGWKPSCKCDAGEPIPCIVMDPFSGSGTTGVVAERYGRDYVGIELSLDYIQLAKQRMTHNQMRLTT